jgi:Flp pilus assembly protein TadD
MLHQAKEILLACGLGKVRKRALGQGVAGMSACLRRSPFISFIIGALLIGTIADAGASPPELVPGKTTLTDMTKQLGAPIATRTCPDIVAAIFVRTAFRGATANGQPVQLIESVYQATFGTDGVLKFALPWGQGRMTTPSDWTLRPCPGKSAARTKSCSSPHSDVATSACTDNSAKDSGQKPAADFSNRAYAYTEKGQLDLAIADFDRAIELNPTNPKFFVDRGSVFLRKGQHDRAIADFDHAIRLKPRYSDAFVNRCAVYTLKRQYDRAISDCDQAVRFNANSAEAFVTRGGTYGQMGDFSRAIQDFDQAVRLKPDFGAAYANRAIARRALGQQAEAAADLVKAKQLNNSYGSRNLIQAP